jgi:hypothetical protein
MTDFQYTSFGNYAPDSMGEDGPSARILCSFSPRQLTSRFHTRCWRKVHWVPSRELEANGVLTFLYFRGFSLGTSRRCNIRSQIEYRT